MSKLVLREASAVPLIEIAGVDSKPFEHLTYPVKLETTTGEDRKWEHDEEDLDSLEAEYVRRGESEPVPMLYNHKKDGPGAGWITGWRRAAEGLYLTYQFTPAATKAINDGEYRYVSPSSYGFEDADGVFHPRSPREVSLVPIPALKLGLLKAANQGGSTVDEKLAQLRVALGLPETATAEEILDAAGTAIAAAKAAETEAAAAKTKADTEAAAAAAKKAETENASAGTPALVAAASVARLTSRVDHLELSPKLDKMLFTAREAGAVIPEKHEKTIREAAVKHGMAYASELIETYPKGQAVDAGSVQKTGADGKGDPPQHRFDKFGPKVTNAANASPSMKLFGRKIVAIQQAEAAGRKFTDAAEAFEYARGVVR